MAKDITDKNAESAGADVKANPDKVLEADSLKAQEAFLKAEKEKAKQPKPETVGKQRASGEFGKLIIEGVEQFIGKVRTDAPAKVQAKEATEPQKATLDAAAATLVAAQIYNYTFLFNKDFERVADLLKGRSAADIKAIDEQFKKAHGVSLTDHLRDEFSASEFKKLQEFLNPKPVQPAEPPPKYAPEPPKPKAVVETDTKGHVTKVATEKGATYEFKHDRHGKVVEMHAPDGNWKSKDGAHWKNEKGEQATGSVEVKSDGTIRRPVADGERIEKVDGSSTHIHKDGSKEVQKADGSTLIVREGHVTRVAYANGNFRDFEYDAAGKLTRIAGDAGHWTTKDGKNWKTDKGQETVAEISVDENGNYRVKDSAGKETVSLTDGRKAHVEKSGSVRVVTPDGKLTNTIDANGRQQKCEYDAEGHIRRFSTPDGVVWNTDDGQSWTNANSAKAWKVSVAANEDGTRKLTDEKGSEITLKLDGTTEIREANGKITIESAKGERRTVQYPIDRIALDKTTDAIVKALPKEYDLRKIEPYDILKARNQQTNNAIHSVDRNAYKTIMSDKTEAERQIIREMYKTKTGEDLETALERTMKEADRIRAKAQLEYGSSDRVSRVFCDLVDHQSEGGLSSGKAEQSLRDTIATMNSKEIEELKAAYEKRYACPLEQAIEAHEHISAETKALLKVYMKGSDHRAENDAEMLRLANVAVDKKKMWMFQEIFRDGNVSDNVRKQFMDNNGEQRIKETWGFTMPDYSYPMPTIYKKEKEIIETPDMRHALDFVRDGHLSISSQAADNTGTFNDNETAIKHSAVAMPDADR
jgi:YD repeat-containing protein